MAVNAVQPKSLKSKAGAETKPPRTESKKNKVVGTASESDRKRPRTTSKEDTATIIEGTSFPFNKE